MSIVDWAQVVTAVAAIVGIPLISAQIWVGQRQAKSARTASFLERLAARDLRGLRSRVLGFLTVEDAADCVRKLQAYHGRLHADDDCLPPAAARPWAPRATVNELEEIMSFFEEMGAAYSRGELVDRVMHVTFPLIPVQFYATGWWYLCWVRGGGWVPPRQGWLDRRVAPLAGDTELWQQWQWMVQDLREKVPDTKAFAPAARVRVFCLPPDPDAASHAQWETATRWSVALNAQVDSLPTLTLDLDAAATRADAGKGAPWRVVIVPRTIDPPRVEVDANRELADTLGELLRDRTEAAVEQVLVPA